ncbi:hypothetical protein [Capnocytophaga gingivalis]|uniref:Uncharacterized protein n=1 Tax=Capnocytophaga gingivalis TaxID=1017 RepID=A0ABU5Z4X5_9FLAO|nr:hypothetical protein [Capnocytophaga gingivalis]MEB3073980.1 hypothetical protein [Capnocytophaga gingivalis]
MKRTIIDLVYLLKIKYKMFFGNEKNLNNLYYYILGYIGAKIDEGVEEIIDKEFVYNFDGWLYKKYDDKFDHPVPWNIVYNTLFIDEEEKLNTFYSDFDDFIKENISE